METQIIPSDRNLSLVLEAIEAAPGLAESTKHQYRKAVLGYVEEGGDLTDPHQLTRYAKTVGSSTRAFLSAAVTKLAGQIEQEVKERATPGNVQAVQAAVYRAEALRGAVKTGQPKGQRAHTWLSQAEVKALLDTCADGIVGERDRLALGLMVAAGLRRREAAELAFEDVKRQPVRGKMRTVLDVNGKGAKMRVVPISDRLAEAIEEWCARTGGQGWVLRSLGRSKELGKSISPTELYNIVQKRGAMIGLSAPVCAGRTGGKPDLAPHDLRRTYAQLGYEAGIPITQISILLGHASVETTQRYLNLELDLETTVSDFIPF
ncbi:MAG: tyrosine-type recombinase/integrase [Chloroflexota bacterium]|nr:tyrosine-type recombinase/integrase [Chloroflexota bacterium]